MDENFPYGYPWYKRSFCNLSTSIKFFEKPEGVYFFDNVVMFIDQKQSSISEYMVVYAT